MLGLSFGVPVIAPNIGSMVDLITDDRGILYDPMECDGLFAAMNRIRTRTYSGASIIAFAETFNWSRSAQAIRAALSKL